MSVCPRDCLSMHVSVCVVGGGYIPLCSNVQSDGEVIRKAVPDLCV